MSKARRWTEEEKDQVEAMYKAGAKYKEITAATGMPQATITLVLHDRRVHPRRVPRENVSVRALMADLASAQLELGRVTEQRDAALAENDRLRQRLTAAASSAAKKE